MLFYGYYDNDKLLNVICYETEENVQQDVLEQWQEITVEDYNNAIDYYAKSQIDIKQQLTDFVQSVLDSKAQEKGYDNIVSACSYANSTNETFKAEALACISWRDAVWTYCNNQLALFEAGEREIPSEAELLAELPSLEW